MLVATKGHWPQFVENWLLRINGQKEAHDVNKKQTQTYDRLSYRDVSE
jgi:hypothetical protein